MSSQGEELEQLEGWTPQAALPLHQILLSLLETCPSLACTPQLESWPGPSLPQACTGKLRIRGKGGEGVRVYMREGLPAPFCSPQ